MVSLCFGPISTARAMSETATRQARDAGLSCWTYHLDNLKQVGRVGLYTFKLPARKRNLLRRCTFVP